MQGGNKGDKDEKRRYLKESETHCKKKEGEINKTRREDTENMRKRGNGNKK